MLLRPWIEVGGQPGAGKTMFIERLLSAGLGLAVCLRAERDPQARTEAATAPAHDAELRRYARAGAAAVARYRFAETGSEAIYSSDPLQEYSQLVVIEGESPCEWVDCRVFVARPLPAGETLLRRVRIEPEARRSQHHRRQLLRGAPGSEWNEQHPMLRELMRYMQARGREPAAPARREAWTLADGFAGIELAQLVVVNVRSEAERAAAAALLGEVARLRKDREVFGDVIGLGGTRHPVTAVATDLAGAGDAGWQKVLAKLRRVVRQAQA